MRNHSTASPVTVAAPAAPLIDIGINLAHDSYDADREAVLARAEAAGVVQMVITGSTLESTRRALALARAHPGRLFATAGVHPHHASELGAQREAELEELARAPPAATSAPCFPGLRRRSRARAGRRWSRSRARAARRHAPSSNSPSSGCALRGRPRARTDTRISVQVIGIT